MKCLFCNEEATDSKLGIPLCEKHKKRWFSEK